MSRRAPRTVPLARRQLVAERGKLVLAIVGVALSVALVGLLLGLRAGISEQATTYANRSGAEVYVGGKGARDLYVTDSFVDAGLVRRIRQLVPGTDVAAITTSLEMLTLHGRKAATFLVGWDPGQLGGPWQLHEGRRPAAADEIAVDRVFAATHGLVLGDRLAIRGRPLRVVALTDRTTAWMAPLLFATRAQTNAASRRGDVASYIVVRGPGSPQALADKLRPRLRGFAVLTRDQIAGNDRELMSGPFRAPLLVMVLVALGVGALVIGLSVYGFVTERRREFGMLKAIGGSAGRLYGSVAATALTIGGCGLAAGVMLQRLGAGAMTAIEPKYLFVFEPGHLALAAVAAVGMGLAGALVPARLIAGLDPVEVFRR